MQRRGASGVLKQYFSNRRSNDGFDRLHHPTTMNKVEPAGEWLGGHEEAGGRRHDRSAGASQ
jgi:hypothetical protein